MWFGNRGGGAAALSVSDRRLEATTPLIGGAHLSAAAGGRELGRGRCAAAGPRDEPRGPLAGARGNGRGGGESRPRALAPFLFLFFS